MCHSSQPWRQLINGIITISYHCTIFFLKWTVKKLLFISLQWNSYLVNFTDFLSQPQWTILSSTKHNNLQLKAKMPKWEKKKYTSHDIDSSDHWIYECMQERWWWWWWGAMCLCRCSQHHISLTLAMCHESYNLPATAQFIITKTDCCIFI